MKEIVIFNSDNAAGVSMVLKNIIKYSPASDVKYKLVLYHFDKDLENPVIEDWCNEVYRIKLCSKDNLFTTIKRLRRFVSPNSIIIANDVTELRMCALLKLKNPLIYIVHGNNKTYYLHCKYYQDYMDLIIPVSTYIAKILDSELKIENRKKIKPIFYPVTSIKLENTYKHSNLELVYAGSITDMKGAELFPLIIKQLSDSAIQYQFTIIGSGDKQNWLKEQFINNKRVCIVGQKSNGEVLEIFKKSDILLFPTKSEGLPNVVVEAMKAGCIPVVSGIESGIPDIIDNGINGFMVNPDNPNQFADAIIELAKSPERITKIRTAAINKANEMFEPFKNAANYCNAFCSVKPKTKIPNTKIPKGRLLNQRCLPNWLVKNIRKLNLNKSL